MPRRSIYDRMYPATPSEPLRVPGGLTKTEREIFTTIIAANPPEHFRLSDTPLLINFVRACAEADAAIKGKTLGSTMPLLSLSDQEMDAVMQAAAPIDPAHRDAFLQEIAAELAKCPAEQLGPGSVFRAIRDVQRRHLTPLRTWDAIGKRHA